jgi:hypothetical protein
VPFPEKAGDCSLWMSSSGGGLFDERRDSNPSLGAFVFWGSSLRSSRRGSADDISPAAYLQPFAH